MFSHFQLFDNWERIQELGLKEAADLIYGQFKNPRYSKLYMLSVKSRAQMLLKKQ
jgi:hypothetical protein